LRNLKMGGSLIALIGAMSFFATSAAAQGQSDTQELEAVVVTGSSIRGVAPIGSNLVSVGQEAIAKTGAVNASQLVNTVPSITTAGSAPVGENSYSYYSPQIHSLAGSGSNTTLVIIDGLRMVGGGTQYAQTDPNIIPTSAIQRVEVLADGASSVYGSDAVAGVVNFITRRTFDGIEVNARAGYADHYKTYDLNAIWGTSWETGGVYIAGQFIDQGALNNRHRDFLSAGDYRPYGGTNQNSFNCSPATIRTPQSGNNVYLSPTALTTVANTPENAPCNNLIYGASIQGARRETGMVKVFNQFGEKLTVTATMNYNHLKNSRENGPGTVSGITAFGPGSFTAAADAGRRGQINPFYVAPAGQPGATQETISWRADRPDGNYGSGESENDTFYATAVAEYELTDNWSIKLSNALGRSRSTQFTRNSFCSACAILAINGTAQSSGSPTASNVPGEQIVSLNLPLTTANALDVWGANGGRTSAEVLRRLYSNNTMTEHYNVMNQTRLETQGLLFSLPAGDVRAALGIEHMWVRQDVEGTNPNNTSNTGSGSAYRLMNLGRKVNSVYGEIVIPVVSAEMGVPLVRSFDVNISGRYDKYDDVGSTTNPKFAANWEIVEGLRIRGNYATAFVAPPLSAVGDPAQGYMRSPSGASVSGQILVPTDIFPNVRLLPGCATAGATCQIGLTNNQGLDRSYGVGPDAKPQTGDSWSVGVDFTPTYIPGFTANVTYWTNKFEGGVTAPSAGQVLQSEGLRDRFTLCPTGCTPAQIDAFTNVANGANVSGSIPATVYFLMRRDSGNILNLDVAGIDAMFNYRMTTDTMGIFTVGGSITHFTKYDQDFGGDVFSVLNTSGFNVTFPSIQTKARAQMGWENGPIAVDVFANYTGSYYNWFNSSLVPIALDPKGNPTGGGDKVKSDLTFDMHASYTFGEDVAGLMSGSQVYIDINNVFDKDPPFFNGNTAGIGVGGWGYNGFTSNPIGRMISVGARARF
jgi:iron complex outermembrane receptor protein